MKISRCPTCHASIHIDQIAQDAAASELLAIFAKQPTPLATAVISYIALFRPAKSDLNNGRALRLVNDVMDLTPNTTVLQRSLEQTATQLSNARINGDSRPLNNHNYLIKVLHAQPCWDHAESDNQPSPIEQKAQPKMGNSKTAQALASLNNMLVDEDE
jgi:hypothetical protein